jgi:hypothetical protein
MKIALIVGSVIVALVLGIVMVGWMLPVAHRASREAVYRAAPGALFAAVSNVSEYPKWRPSVKEVEVLPAEGGEQRFREIGGNGRILFAIESVEPNTRMTTRIADPSLPFGGRWTYELSPVGDGTRLRITEDGEVRNPIFRFVSRFVLGHHATIDQYLSDLGRKLGQPVEITEAAAAR